jgi:tetratricopeptide (TPR) repeat protein
MMKPFFKILILCFALKNVKSALAEDKAKNELSTKAESEKKASDSKKSTGSEKSTDSEKSDEERSIEVHERKTRVGAKIAPPTGQIQNEKKSRSAVEDLFGLPPGESSSDDEMSVPAEGIFQDPAEKERQELEKRRRERNLQPLDRELSGGRKSMDDRHSKDLLELDKSLGVESEPSDEGSQSYTLSVIQIKKLFKSREYEEALISLTELLRQYPLSIQLLLMKGTLHQRLDQIDLALAAYEKAFEFEPSQRLKAQIDYLKRRRWERENLRGRAKGSVTPLGIEESVYFAPVEKSRKKTRDRSGKPKISGESK